MESCEISGLCSVWLPFSCCCVVSNLTPRMQETRIPIAHLENPMWLHQHRHRINFNGRAFGVIDQLSLGLAIIDLHGDHRAFSLRANRRYEVTHKSCKERFRQYWTAVGSRNERRQREAVGYIKGELKMYAVLKQVDMGISTWDSFGVLHCTPTWRLRTSIFSTGSGPNTILWCAKFCIHRHRCRELLSSEMEVGKTTICGQLNVKRETMLTKYN